MSVHACPKPPAETDAEKRHRKIEAARKLERSRRVPLPRSSKSVQRTKPLPKKNDAKRGRKRSLYAKKLAAYRKSETYKAVEKRSGGRCERILTARIEGPYVLPQTLTIRCLNKRSDGLKMVHNHLTYARFGGHELPSDIELLCPSCNALYESQKRGTRRFSGAQGGGDK